MMACKISGDEIAAFSPSASSKGVTPFAVVFVLEDVETEHVLDSAVEVEKRGADREKDENREEIVETCPQGSEVNEAAKEVVEGR